MIPRGWSHVSQTETRELMEDAAYIKRVQDQARGAVVSTLENNLAQELERRAAKQIRDDQNRIRVCDKSEELRALKVKLMEAKVSRERAAQLLESQLRSEDDRYREALLDERLEEERLHIHEEERAAQLRREYQRKSANAMQKEQIEERERLRRDNAREALLEKEQVDALVDKLRREEEAEALARFNQLQEQRRVFNEFAVLRDDARRDEQRRRQQELEEIEEFNRAKKERDDRFDAQKREIESEKKRIQAQLLNQYADRDRRQQEQEYLLNQLHAEEAAEADRLKDLAAKEKALRDRVDMLRSYQRQLAEKEERKSQDALEEAKFRQAMLQKFAEEERVEQLTEQKKRLKVKEHMERVKDLWEERKRRFEAERDQELRDREREIRDREEELAIVEDERRRLLAQFADLRNFLPPGVLKSKDDATMVDNELHRLRTSAGFQTQPVRVPEHIERQPLAHDTFTSKHQTIRSMQAPEVHSAVKRGGRFNYTQTSSNIFG